MEIHISRKDMENKEFFKAQQRFANAIGAELIVDTPIVKPKRYDCTIWLDENNDVASDEFNRKKDALAWAKSQLEKHPTAVADLKKWNAKGDDFEDWQYRIIEGEFTEVGWF